jgi:hypothetical protein
MKNDSRAHIRMPQELKEQIQDYAARHNTTLSALATQYFTHLLHLEKQRLERLPDAEQV